jgi:uncharacterized protein with HEPN domain
MSEREDRVRLQHMLDASRQAIAFVQGRRRNDLDADLQLTLALTRLVEIVGEAAKNVSDEERQQHSEVPWRANATSPPYSAELGHNGDEGPYEASSVWTTPPRRLLVV